ncbi:dienelactone hydrolase family protein [Methylophaga nitratireducenticrescens]|uniref:Dienelactone hydrolase-like enzyme n=1 Tax=Methylophaga nitratireducenticrescens TaxID=754476 RepID=I1XJM9_METNJ|nr:dienelactone hydrolase family protein [Methylophaga nitratireducenticrescens]AFI84598.1 dienelactone hydrolase [Methylophaga nitratireducenticrescens]AUZ84615.1 dienelactone hydrolase [Methylophaga nitratireducenticrescens]
MKWVVLAFFWFLSFPLPAKPVHYQVNDEIFEGYFVSSADSAPLVILIHDWDGVTDYEIKRANMLFDAGYAVFAVDIYGAGVRPVAIADRKHHTGELYRDRQRMRDLINGGINKAKQLGAATDNAVMMGYCLGGTAVLEMARAGSLMKGFVAIHGGLGTPEDQNYKNVQAEILVQHGSADANITMKEFITLSAAMDKDSAPNEMIVYGGAEHSFTKAGNPHYDADADEKSWQRLLTFLDEKLR